MAVLHSKLVLLVISWSVTLFMVTCPHVVFLSQDVGAKYYLSGRRLLHGEALRLSSRGYHDPDHYEHYDHHDDHHHHHDYHHESRASVAQCLSCLSIGSRISCHTVCSGVHHDDDNLDHIGV